jgi:hypothetical protein
MSLKSVLSRVLIVLMLTANTAPAQVQDENSRVVVPDLPGGARVAGCYKADRGLYGPNVLTFCLQRRGIYAVRSDNLSCDGRLTWATEGRDVTINLRRQRCNRGLAWAEGNIVCRPRSALDLLLGDILGGKQKSGSRDRVVVRDDPTVAKLTCTYRPTVRGERSVSFFAIRKS